jgi:flagellar protein FliO/FliZ
MDTIDYIRFLAALALVIGLIMALSWGLKRMGVGTSSTALTSRRRLRTVESTSIDSRHRLVLVRRDAVEHLVLLGPTSSQVIETGIPATAGDIAADDPPPSLADALKSVLPSIAKP